jgi:hypothetical protein
MARCGSPEGARVLITYLDDARALYAAHARAELAAVAGEDLGGAPGPWTTWLARRPDGFPPRPWTARID